jgi:hypothetical protein
MFTVSKLLDGGAYIKKLHHMSTVMTERADPSLVRQGWVGDKPCIVTMDTGAYIDVARPDIATRWQERQQNQCYTLQTVTAEALNILMEA